ncbi:ABC transporter substrate-binding protein [Herbivorax sp. ANBcel31]|uniref:ABC transporter substrate-binding protein n=1 Tax=Herbivorax sp. ANBcel31 TaxID=3069754 RepID=UPI0027B6482B|nr:ABC transporter substrate-binding protein [Herbivorax sp. ANBcel31]MDQ2085589.1 ABC transporter substrate-binding protein [Herbivorax sp. ANBcel31]
MIKKFKLAILLILSVFLVLMIGCMGNAENLENNDKEEGTGEIDSTQKDDTVVLKLWSWYSLKDVTRVFEEENEGIIVEEKLFGFGECEEAYMEAITKGEGPDILIFDSGFFGTFTASGILQDLLQEPFNAGKYKNDFLGWESGLSIDNSELLSLTINTSPYVSIYRADIMKEMGFPYEPEEFGEFIKEPENVLEIAKKLKEDDKYIFQFPTDLPDLTGATLGFFDENLEYTRFGDLFELSLDLAKETHQNELELKKNFWNETGKKALKEDKLVMVTEGSYAMANFRRDIPEQSGLWRVTTPPLGLAAWASDSRISINSQSNHKEEAWRVVEYIATHKSSGGETFDVVPGYIPVHGYGRNMNREEEYYGNQSVYPKLEELAVDMVQYKLTPFDAQALQMYRDGVWEAADSSLPSEVHIEQMKEEIEETIELAR